MICIEPVPLRHRLHHHLLHLLRRHRPPRRSPHLPIRPLSCPFLHLQWKHEPMTCAWLVFLLPIYGSIYGYRLASTIHRKKKKKNCLFVRTQMDSRKKKIPFLVASLRPNRRHHQIPRSRTLRQWSSPIQYDYAFFKLTNMDVRRIEKKKE